MGWRSTSTQGHVAGDNISLVQGVQTVYQLLKNRGGLLSYLGVWLTMFGVLMLGPCCTVVMWFVDEFVECQGPGH